MFVNHGNAFDEAVYQYGLVKGVAFASQLGANAVKNFLGDRVENFINLITEEIAMALEFIRWGHCDPSVGMSREEYIAAHAENDALKAANEGWDINYITNLRGALWNCHHPPEGVKGIYVFVRQPQRIEFSLIPDHVKNTWWESTSGVEDRDARCHLYNDIVEDILNAEALHGAEVFALEEVSRVWIPVKCEKFGYESIRWQSADTQNEIEAAIALADEEQGRLVTEVFIELR